MQSTRRDDWPLGYRSHCLSITSSTGTSELWRMWWFQVILFASTPRRDSMEFRSQLTNFYFPTVDIFRSANLVLLFYLGNVSLKSSNRLSLAHAGFVSRWSWILFESVFFLFACNCKYVTYRVFIIIIIIIIIIMFTFSEECITCVKFIRYNSKVRTVAMCVIDDLQIVEAYSYVISYS
jgi:hypothetical protein